MQLQNALGKIWDMYNSTLSEGLEDATNKARQIKELASEKTKFEQKYYSVILNVNKLIDDAEKRVMEKNLAKLKECSEVEEVKKEKHVLMQEVQEVKREKTELMQELEEVKREKTQLMQELALLKDS
jgi:FtsZ-binding cell division protein ZapB